MHDAFLVSELDVIRRVVVLSEREFIEWSFFVSERGRVVTNSGAAQLDARHVPQARRQHRRVTAFLRAPWRT